MQRPEFSSIVVGMMLVMAIPAIFAALVLKSRSFDKNRYEFDPNRTWSVLEQGRGFKSLEEADAAVKAEMERLALERKNLVDNVKKLDEAMLALRAVAGTSAAVAQAFPSVLQSLAGRPQERGRRRPAAVAWTSPRRRSSCRTAAGRPPAAAGRRRRRSAPPAAAAGPRAAPPAGNGLAPAQVEAELAAVPEPQKGIAAMLPLADLPPGWTVGQVGRALHRDVQRREPLREDRRPRRELPPVRRQGDGVHLLPPHRRPVERAPALHLRDGRPAQGPGQVRLREARRGQGHPGRRPRATPRPAARSSTRASTTPRSSRPRTTPSSPPSRSSWPSGSPPSRSRAERPGAGRGASPPAGRGRRSPTPAEAKAAAKPRRGRGHARDLLRLPAGGGQAGRPQVRRPGCLRLQLPLRRLHGRLQGGRRHLAGLPPPLRDAKEAKEVLREVHGRASSRTAPRSRRSQAEGADEMVVSSNIGLFDVVFRKGNTLAGANGATEPQTGRGLRPGAGQEPAGTAFRPSSGGK